jgi:hypothetical protein
MGEVVLVGKSDKRDSFSDYDRGLCAKIQPQNVSTPSPFHTFQLSPQHEEARKLAHRKALRAQSLGGSCLSSRTNAQMMVGVQLDYQVIKPHDP